MPRGSGCPCRRGSEGILSAAPTDGAFRSDLMDEALKNLTDDGVDVIGNGWSARTIELREGGE